MMNALKSEKHEVEKRAARLGHWMFASILVIVVGLIVEYIPDLLNETSTAAAAVRRIGEFLVIAGVASELVIHWLQTRVETRVREINDRISRKAERRIAKLHVQAEHERTERVRLERQMADRVLSDEQSAELAEELAKFAGQKISIRAFPPGHEPLVFASTISIALNRAGWLAQLLDSRQFDSPGSIWCGGWILYSTDEKSVEAGMALGAGLHRLGYPGGGIAGLSNAQESRLELVVQTRHSPPRGSIKM
jgi:hypothetical protein